MSQCHGFKRRLIWHLNSIERNNAHSDHEIVASVAVCDQEHKAFILRYFPDTKVVSVPKRIFGLRGYCRNRQVANMDTDTDFACFVDCDQVYDVGYFDEFSDKAVQHDLANKRTVVGVSRVSWPENYGESMISSMDWRNYDKIVKMAKEHDHVLPLVFSSALADSKRYDTRNVCAGYWQSTHVSNLNGKYIHGETRDGCTFKYGKTKMRSDQQFRKEIGHVTKWKMTLNQYHLNHDRDYTKEK